VLVEQIGCDGIMAVAMTKSRKHALGEIQYSKAMGEPRMLCSRVCQIANAKLPDPSKPLEFRGVDEIE
jgi:hypothetical protein